MAIMVIEAFLTQHPELTDGKGVVTLGDSLRRFPQRVNLDAMVMLFDKPKG